MAVLKIFKFRIFPTILVVQEFRQYRLESYKSVEDIDVSIDSA